MLTRPFGLAFTKESYAAKRGVPITKVYKCEACRFGSGMRRFVIVAAHSDVGRLEIRQAVVIYKERHVLCFQARTLDQNKFKDITIESLALPT